MILAGIDEAGLGPQLGPLVCAAAALRSPDDWQHNSPWEKLANAVTPAFKKKESRLPIGDSKAIYTKGGVEALELSVQACLSNTAQGRALNREQPHLPLLCPALTSERLGAYPWYSHALRCQPALAQEKLAAAASLLNQAMGETGAEMALLRALPLLEGEFNASIDSGLNKSEAAQELVIDHLRHIAASFPSEKIRVYIDKQGGRNFYLPMLSKAFPGAWIETIEEGAESSAYRIERAGGADIHILLTPRAEPESFCVALASLAAKYVRELFMEQLNSFFLPKVPGLRPTAGYPGDAPRFITATKQIRDSLNICDELFIRKR